MNDFQRNELSGDVEPRWRIEVLPEKVVSRPGAQDDDALVDWDRSTFKITLRGSLQSGYDLSDAITSASTFYSNVAVRDRQSAPASAKEHAYLARHMSSLADQLEDHLDGALNAAAGDAAIELAGNH